MSYNNSKKTPPVALGYANKPASGCVFLMQKHVYIRANEGIKEAIEILFDFNTLYYKKASSSVRVMLKVLSCYS